MYLFAIITLALACSSPVLGERGLSSLPTCTSPFREITGVCTGQGLPEQRLWGSADRAYFTYFSIRDAREPSGSSRPSARAISNTLFKQSSSIPDARGLNEIAAYFTQFLLHDLSLTRSGDQRFDIPIPPGDTAGAFTDAIPFFRSLRSRSRFRDSHEFPINFQTSPIDLSTIYGASKLRNNAVRVGVAGMMAVSEGDLLTFSSDRRVDNLPEYSKDYFLSGDLRANENPVLTCLHTIFVREHNRIAKELADLMPDLTDEILFMKARSINGAQFQKIVFEEWYPAITNEKLPPYTGFNNEVDPTVSVTFSTAGFQAHHSMTGNNIKRRGPGNVRMTSLIKAESFFRTVSTLQKDGVELYLRGAFVAKAQAIDTKISTTRRNILYSNIPGLENNTDIASEIIQRGRDHGVPSYLKVRTSFGMPKILKIEEITTNKRVREALKTLYGRPSTIDAYPGMLAEDHVEGSSIGPTMLNLWKAEFTRLRAGDRFYFRSKNSLPKDVLKVPTVKKLFSNEDTFRRIVLTNTMITEKELPRRMFFVR